MSDLEYWAIYRAVVEMLHSYNLFCNDSFVHNCVIRVQEDAGEEWNSDDVRIAIRNAINDLMEQMI